jgi:hypothetical protein
MIRPAIITAPSISRLAPMLGSTQLVAQVV